tara:strand:- start:283 stop:1293 length:1011 start_codon:yes stop_codon:yes gene_type:complete
MKKINNSNKNNFFKRLFIKISRLLGFEIIDQAQFRSPTLQKNLDEMLSIPGKKSITLPMGEIKIKKKFNSIKIILRTCTSELIMDQNKRRLFDFDKKEYTLRTLKSLINSINNAKSIFHNIKFELSITDTNSTEKDISMIKEILKNSNLKSNFVSVNLEEFRSKIKEGYSKAKFANMANFYNSLITAKNEDFDLFYFVEDDYIHSPQAITEMICSYEKFYTIFDKDLILIPSDYPYLYTKDESTKIYIGEKYHWRLVSESLVTFMTSKNIVNENYYNLEKMGIEWIDPWEKPLHEIYKKNPCFSPMPSLAYHCTNINSVFGVSPLIDIKKLWDENK